MIRNHLLLATRNLHKVGEIAAILGPGLRVDSLLDLSDPPALVEDAATFADNASRKAEQLAQWLAAAPNRHPPRFDGDWLGVVADDSGLEVDALGGAPGVHSARFARLGSGRTGNATDAENNACLLARLTGVARERRTSRFRCVLALVELIVVRGPTTADRGRLEIAGPARLFEGVSAGTLELEPRGTRGFGYDPLFVPEGYDRTFAELENGVKNRLSHRFRALAQLRAWLGEESVDGSLLCAGGPG